MMPAFAWLSAIEARALLRRTSTLGISTPTVALTIALLVPWGQLLSNLYNPAIERQTAFLSKLADVTEGRPEPAAISVVAECRDPAEMRRTNEALARLTNRDGREAIRWATGWHQVSVTTSAAAASPPLTVLEVFYCLDGTIRVS